MPNGQFQLSDPSSNTGDRGSDHGILGNSVAHISYGKNWGTMTADTKNLHNAQVIDVASFHTSSINCPHLCICIEIFQCLENSLPLVLKFQPPIVKTELCKTLYGNGLLY